MNIFIAKNAGFCFGVKRAVESAYKEIKKNNSTNIYSLGELIHNPQVVNDLTSKGIRPIDNLNLLNKGDNVIIRTHGVSKEVYDIIKEKQVNIIDMTCPFVKKVQKIVYTYYHKGYSIIIVGDKKHPEVVGVNGWCNNKAYVVNSLEDVERIPKLKKACVVAQTTIIEQTWNDILNALKGKVEELVFFNTICDATQKRQMSADELSKIVDVMIVIGGKKSSNTQKLKKICEQNCKNTIQIESANELSYDMIKNYETIGITAGASTPDFLISDVVDKVMNLRKDDIN